MPLCCEHQHELHRHGNEIAWWANVNLAPLEVAKSLWEVTRSGRGNTICQIPFAIRGVRRPRHRNEQSQYWHADPKQVIVQTRSERTAEEWCEDSDAASEMEARLEGNGV